ncbi:MAG: hypothetical protein FWD38_00750 [Oscillospiraceae bacterium]|nr:hypothetical protein [Oscillospiraceae bacterium]
MKITDIFKRKSYSFARAILPRKIFEILSMKDHNIFSQFGEDVIIFSIFQKLKININDVTYIDLGANDPIVGSNTYLFYLKNARGVLVEANPGLINTLKKKRPRDTVLNMAVSIDSDKEENLYIMNSPSLSTLSYEEAQSLIEKRKNLEIIDVVKIKTISVNDIVQNFFCDKPPTILSIDLEGLDEVIIRSIDFSKYRPFLIISEVVEYNTSLPYGKKNKNIIEYMKSNNYDEYAFTGVNSIFIDSLSN